jgi:hypothetical protein
MISPTAIRITRREGVKLGARVGDGSRGGMVVADAKIRGCNAVMEGVTVSEGLIISVLGGDDAMGDGNAALF